MTSNSFREQQTEQARRSGIYESVALHTKSPRDRMHLYKSVFERSSSCFSELIHDESEVAPV